eukprot:TRINITY_DN45962_c0_g1_i1.p1 TRINITY_DN45962_c0_g1~~TRINITY_DN45962_c0_g1_i1.p1  ORF type:complete len:431 (-),score=43.33 TRINITY_DN45962_c0_g1_i1:131-1423(-)
MVDFVPVQVLLLGVLTLVSLPILALLAPIFILIVFVGIALWCVQDYLSGPIKTRLPEGKSIERWKDFECSGRIKECTHLSRDDIKINYYVVPATASKPNGKVALICQPLGNCGLLHWYATMVTLGPEWTFVSWDYRGFFNSENPNRLRHVSVRDHALDGVDVLTAALANGCEGAALPGLEHLYDDTDAASAFAASLVLGHSMGVQVALELCLLRPDRCDALALFNGTSGHALHSGFQPTLQVPYLGDLFSSMLSLILRDNVLDWYGWSLECMRKFMVKPATSIGFSIYTRVFGSATLRKLLGPNYMSQFMDSYLGGIGKNRKSLISFVRGFQELDAHSCTHLLWQVGCPTLLVAGLWDILTPCYCMARIAKCVTGETRLVIDPYSTHSTLLEHPERALGELQHFVQVNLPRSLRKDSTSFHHLASHADES